LEVVGAEMLTNLRKSSTMRFGMASSDPRKDTGSPSSLPSMPFIQGVSGVLRTSVEDKLMTVVETKQEAKPKVHITLDEWNAGVRLPDLTRKCTFNPVSDSIEWAAWTWNPVTGCLHGCEYCYARDDANLHYGYLPKGQKFTPTIYPGRLRCPQWRWSAHTPRWTGDLGYRSVFTCDMADLFGKWVPREWIQAVLDAAAANPRLNFLMLTKFPQRLVDFTYPPNVWLGTTVDKQSRVKLAESAFAALRKSGYKGICYLSCEPMLERLTFTDLSNVNWIICGGASHSNRTPEYWPPASDIEHLNEQAKRWDIPVYQKRNLIQGISDEERRREYPHEVDR
jgi:protein gp37